MDTVQQTVDTYADMLFRVAWQHLGQREEAEDVVQELCCGLFSTRPLTMRPMRRRG